MKRRLLVLLLVLSVAGGGLAVWNCFKPTLADTQTNQAQSLLEQFPHVSRSVPAPVQSSRTKVLTEHAPANHSTSWGTISIPSINATRRLVEGTTEADLAKGVSHYTGTALPGQVGNFSLAGHVCCESNGQPFKDLYKLKVGNTIVIDTKLATYTYKVIPSTSCGNSQQVVSMYDVQVINPDPCTDAKATRKLMTLTTCQETVPHRHAVMRRIVFAELSSVTYRS